MPHTRSASRPRARQAPALVALALVASLVLALGPGLIAAPARADDASCVGKGEYRLIKGGMSLQRLGEVLDGQSPFADIEGRGTKRVRWYAACDTWQPVKDVKVRYHHPVVGRRTVTGKKLAVYEAPTADGPRDGGGHGPRHGGKKG